MSGSEPSPDSIVFEHCDYCNGHFVFVASFNIQIGSDEYKCDIIFQSHTYLHSDGSYCLDIIQTTNDQTIFCSDEDYDSWSEGGKKVGNLIINIPTFRAPKTDCPLELASALKVLPDDLQSFLRKITWQNPESTAVQAAAEVGSI